MHADCRRKLQEARGNALGPKPAYDELGARIADAFEDRVAPQVWGHVDVAGRNPFQSAESLFPKRSCVDDFESIAHEQERREREPEERHPQGSQLGAGGGTMTPGVGSSPD